MIQVDTNAMLQEWFRRGQEGKELSKEMIEQHNNLDSYCKEQLQQAYIEGKAKQ